MSYTDAARDKWLNALRAMSAIGGLDLVLEYESCRLWSDEDASMLDAAVEAFEFPQRLLRRLSACAKHSPFFANGELHPGELVEYAAQRLYWGNVTVGWVDEASDLTQLDIDCDCDYILWESRSHD